MDKGKRKRAALYSEKKEKSKLTTESQSQGAFAALAPLKAALIAAEEKKREIKSPPKSIKALVQLKADKSDLGEEQIDHLLFEQEMRDVKPLEKRYKRSLAPLPKLKERKISPIEVEDMMVLRDMTDLISGRGEFDFHQTDELMEASVKGFPPNLMERLRRGQFPIQDYLDLHGLNLNQARDAINGFILKSVSLNRTSVLLIHGRGQRSADGVPILKRNLENLLLRKPIKKYILAFTTARPIDGGAGASYILLSVRSQR
ncbi:MAG: Smr/MutS family protein [Deltaproteobacteria bacterium]|jgi:DNA-nicking Smr family endonuclease|nr:Smr/MutS family protein [Deltaproteobacteria bacterium]